MAQLQREREEEQRRQLEEGEIRRVAAKWRFRCKKTKDFVEEKCVQQYCENRRYLSCQGLNRLRMETQARRREEVTEVRQITASMRSF